MMHGLANVKDKKRMSCKGVIYAVRTQLFLLKFGNSVVLSVREFWIFLLHAFSGLLI